MATLFANIVDRIQNNYLLQATINLKYTQANIVESVNNAHKALVAKIRSIYPTRYSVDGATMGLVANQEHYNMPADFGELIRMEYLISGTAGAANALWMPMTRRDRTVRWEFSRRYYGRLLTLEPPYNYYRDELPAAASPWSITHRIGLIPIPIVTLANVMRPIYYYNIPTLSDGGTPADMLYTPEEWDLLVMFEAMELLYIKDSSIFQNYNWKDDLYHWRQKLTTALTPPDQNPDQIRITY